MRPVKSVELAAVIENEVPDYQDRTWLSSGSMELNAYLPLSYYIAHNVHFSHHASLYSQRMAEIEQMSQAQTPAEFMQIIDNGYPRKIDSLLLYRENDPAHKDYYTLYFWRDNFPNGGKDLAIYLPQSLITDQYWQLVDTYDNWSVFIRR